MTEIIAFLSPADKTRFENEVPHPTVVCDTFKDFKREIESRDDEYIIKECMLIFSQDVTVAKDCTLNEELMGFMDENTHFVFRMLDTKADRNLAPKWYDSMAKAELDVFTRINTVNCLYLAKTVNMEFTGGAKLMLQRLDMPCPTPASSIRTHLVKA